MGFACRLWNRRKESRSFSDNWSSSVNIWIRSGLVAMTTRSAVANSVFPPGTVLSKSKDATCRLAGVQTDQSPVPAISLGYFANAQTLALERGLSWSRETSNCCWAFEKCEWIPMLREQSISQADFSGSWRESNQVAAACRAAPGFAAITPPSGALPPTGANFSAKPIGLI